MQALTDLVPVQISDAGWDYRGFTIRTRKVIRWPGYYAWAYKKSGDYGFPVDKCETRAEVIEKAKAAIDDHFKEEAEPPADFGTNDGPDMAKAFDVLHLREQLTKAEAFLATIVKGVNDPSYHAAKYWGGYEAFDKAMGLKKETPSSSKEE